MKWKTKERPKWQWQFLLLPRDIGGTTVWLEWVQSSYETVDEGTWAGGGSGVTYYRDSNGTAIGSIKSYF